jgi:flagellar hook assembly protein FlgD
VRIHYSLIGKSSYSEITIRIFDYAMQPVRTLVQKATRQSGQEYDEIWDGKNDRQSYVANGVYFYRVEVNDQSPIWGKILVLK